jgi:hypothetical protein
MFKFDDSQETGNWLHREAYAEFEQGKLKSVQHAPVEKDETPKGDEQEEVPPRQPPLGD